MASHCRPSQRCPRDQDSHGQTISLPSGGNIHCRCVNSITQCTTRRLHEERSPNSCNALGEARSAITTAERDARLTAVTCSGKVYAIQSMCTPRSRSNRPTYTRFRSCWMTSPERLSARERDMRRLIKPTLVCSNSAIDEVTNFRAQ
jgi:hypothetical protein